MDIFNKLRRPFGIGGSLIALLIAVIYLFVVPEKADEATGGVAVILKYGHTFSWLMISVVSALFANDSAPKLRIVLSYLALASYALFLFIYLIA